MKVFRKMLCLLLVSSMLTLTACNNKPKEVEEEKITKGRYVDTEITPDVENGQTLYFGARSDGSLDAIFAIYPRPSEEELAAMQQQEAVIEDGTPIEAESVDGESPKDVEADIESAVDSTEGGEMVMMDSSSMFYAAEYKHFYSKDKGATWEEISTDWTKQLTEEEKDIRNVVVTDDGEIVFRSEKTIQNEQVQQILDKDGGMNEENAEEINRISMENPPERIVEFYKVASDGNLEKFNVNAFEQIDTKEYEFYVDKMYWCGEDRLFISWNEYLKNPDPNSDYVRDDSKNALVDTSLGETIGVLNPKKENESEDEMMGYSHYIYTVANDMVVSYNSGDNSIAAISTKDGSEIKDKLPKLEDNNNYSTNQIYLDTDGNLYTIDYEYSVNRVATKGSLSEKIVEGSQLSLLTSQSYVDNMFVVDDIIYLSCQGNPNILAKLEYDPDIVNDPSKTITVYAMYQTESVRNTIAEMRKKNPDMNIKIESPEFDYSEDQDYQTMVNDALRTLNTEILAGKGPDVIVLDGMPLESYAEKGILEDLSPLFDGSKEYIDSVINAYKTKDGLFVVPTRFTVPALFGDEEVKDIKTLDDLVKAVEKYPAPKLQKNDSSAMIVGGESQELPENEKPFLNVMTEYEIFSYLAPSCIPEIIKDGEVNKQNLEKFLNAIKDIYDHHGIGDMSEDESVIYGGGGGIMMSMDSDIGETLFVSSGSMFYSYASGQSKAALENYIADSMSITGNAMTKQFYGVHAPGLADGVYIPKDMVGVVSTSNKKELAMEFVKLMLSEEVQNYSVWNGTPVLKSSIDKQREVYTRFINEHNSKDLSGTKVSEINMSHLWEDLNTAYNENDPFSMTLMDVTSQYCKEDITLDEAVKKVVSETEIALAEKK